MSRVINFLDDKIKNFKNPSETIQSVILVQSGVVKIDDKLSVKDKLKNFENLYFYNQHNFNFIQYTEINRLQKINEMMKLKEQLTSH